MLPQTNGPNILAPITPDLGSRTQRLVAGIALVILGIALWVSAGPVGVLIAVVVAVVFSFAPPPYAYATGQLLVVILVVGGPTAPQMPAFLTIQSALAGLLCAALGEWWPREHRLLAASIGVFGLGIVVVVATIYLNPTWIAAVLIALGYGSLAYALHRYERVRLGLIAQSNPDHE